jgi:hypothetical protein
MKRFFLILLLALLPLQFTFAAVSTYCADETVETTATAHFGHHEHNDGKKINDLSKVKPVEKTATDADCHFCHAVFANMPVMFVSPTAPEINLPTDVAPLLLAAQYQTTPLQRPPITSLA